jgi:5'-methylthioadenosine phosphorylase
VCPTLRKAAIGAATEAQATVRDGGTYVCIEGPAFGTRAESFLYRSWGADVVGMTAIPEVKLAREAELCYAILAAVTDYDSWHAGHDAVDAATVFAVLARNVLTSQETVRHLVRRMPPAGECGCGRTLDAALVTPPEAISDEARERLGPILARRLSVPT